MIVRDFEQRSTATVVAVADASLSTRCGIDGVPIAAAIARTIGTIGMSAVFFQDLFGLITFDAKFEQLAAIRPRIGKNQVIHCLDAYQFGTGLQPLKRADSLSMSLAGFMRKTSMVPVISDFLFDEAGDDPEGARPAELGARRLHRADRQRVRLRAAVGLGRLDRGVRRRDRTLEGDVARRAPRRCPPRTRTWQDEVARMAKDNDLDVLRIGVDELQTAIALSEFIAERRLRKAA